MSPRLLCTIVAVAAAPSAFAAGPTQYTYLGQVSALDPGVQGSFWDGVAIGDEFILTLDINPDAAVTESQNVNRKRYAFAILHYDLTIGSIADSGAPDFPEESFSGQYIANDPTRDLLTSGIDTPNYDIYARIDLDPATLSSADIFTTPGTYLQTTSFQSFVGLDDGFGGFITLDMVSLTIVPSPGAASPLVALGAIAGFRRRRSL